MDAEPLTVTAGTSARSALDLMTTCHAHVLPVVETNDRLLGVITDRTLQGLLGRRPRALEMQPVLTVMDTDGPIIGPLERIAEAVRLFYRDSDLDALPVVEDGRFQGLLTRSAVMRALGPSRLSMTNRRFLRRPTRTAKQPDPSIYLG
jgi:CBS domain-containing protein